MTPASNSTLLEQMEKLSDVSITIRAELAQATITFQDLLNLEEGRIIELGRPAGENIDVFAEDVLIGWGEVLLTEGTMTVRIADLQNALIPGLKEDEEAVSASGPEQYGANHGKH